MHNSSGRVAGKIALITGAASGLGEAMAILLASEGAAVVVADIDELAGQGLAKRIGDAGNRAVFRCLDVTSQESWNAAIAAVLDQFGRLDILVNNAGIYPVGDMDMSFDL